MWINKDTVIDFEVPGVLKNMMNLAESADANNDLGVYINYADNIDVLAKNCYSDGAITHEMRNELSTRYTM